MTTPARRSSRWQTQLDVLGPSPGPAAVGEAGRAAALRLPPLTLPERAEDGRRAPSRRWPAVIAGTAAFTALLSLTLLRHPDDPALRPKGRALVQVWRARDGVVRPLVGADAVRDGDRVRVEIKPIAAGVAFWLAVDGHGRPLVGPAFVSASATALSAGLTASLPTSLRIDGDDIGETLLVLLCADAPPAPDRIERWALDPEGLGSAEATIPAGCETRPFKLR